MKSIRLYLLVAVLATITLINFGSALHGYRLSMREAQLLFDRQLRDSAALIAATVDPTYQAAPIQHSELFAFQLWSNDGTLLRRSANAPDHQITDLKEGYSENNFNRHRWRILATQSHPHDHWIVVAERLDLRYVIADKIILTSIVPVLLGLPVSGVLLWLIVSHGLKRLKELSYELRHKRADDLSPITLSQTPVELSAVVTAINSLLARLSASFDRERRFSADAAHELRTPISALQIHLHNLAKELDENNPTLLELQQSAKRLAHLVEQTLTLYRTNPEHYLAQFETLDLYGICQQVIADSYTVFDQRHQTIELIGESSELQGDRFSLSLLLSNLLSNASKYSPPGGEIQVLIKQTNERVILTVNDSGEGIPEDQYELVLQRFYRVGGDSHNPDIPGCGLGLSIVQHIAQLHRATLQFGRSPLGHGLSVQLSFPRHHPNDQYLS